MSRTLCLGLFGLIVTSMVSGADGQEKKLKELQWSHAFDLACRKYGEPEITKETKRWGVEAFRDNNTGFGLYISQAGTMALAPNFAGLAPPVNPSKGPSWLTGNDLPARKAGVNPFDKNTKVHSM